MSGEPYLLAAAGSLTLVTSNQTAEIPVQQEIQLAQNNPVEVVEAAPAEYPNRIEINVVKGINLSQGSNMGLAIGMPELLSMLTAEAR